MGAFGNLLRERWGNPNTEVKPKPKKRGKCSDCKKITNQIDMGNFATGSKWYCLSHSGWA